MATAEVLSPLAELLDRLGGIPAERVRMVPYPGSATEADALKLIDRREAFCELIDGVLVEKAMGVLACGIATELIFWLMAFVKPRRLGKVYAGDNFVRLWPGRLRAPDVAFYSWDRLPLFDTRLPNILSSFPDLAVEVLSDSNTVREMELKRRDLFACGTRLFWEVEPELRSVAIYTNPDTPDTILHASDTLTGGDVLPGFTLSLSDLFRHDDPRVAP